MEDNNKQSTFNEEKFKKIASNKWSKYLGIIIIGIIIGRLTLAGKVSTLKSDLNNLKATLADTESKNVELSKGNDDLESKNKNLESKVVQAKPFFDMEESEKEKMRLDAAEEKSKLEEEKKAKKEAEEKAELDAKKVTLDNGKWQCGKDFDAGTYTLVAIKGGGNVICSGSINAIMGPQDDGFYQKKYSNISFKKGQILDLRNVTVELTPGN